jgi:hypothetical protein
MVSLRTIVKKAVSIADSVTKSLQGVVIHAPWIGQDGDGTARYGPSHRYKAIIDLKEIQRHTPSGQLVLTTASILFLQPLPPNGAAGRTEPIDPRDKLVLPDGTTGPIVIAAGFVDAGTGHPFFGEVWLTR